jgi:hypothetical protein
MAIANAIVQLRGYLEVAELLFDPAITYWNENREDLVCQFYNATSQNVLYNAVMTAVEEYLEFFWESIDEVPIVRTALLWAWRNVFLRESLFGLALNAIVPPDWIGDGTSVDCACGVTGFPEPPEVGGALYLFVNPASITQNVESEYTTSFSAESTWENYEYGASFPTGATWSPEILAIPEPELPGDVLIGYAFRTALLSVAGGNDPAGGAVRYTGSWAGTFNHVEGNISAVVSTDYDEDFSDWVTANSATLVAINPLLITSELELDHYRRSGVSAPAGTVTVITELRFIYRREV